MKIAVASDHRGVDTKHMIKALVTDLGHECIDCGTSDNNPVDYPDLAYSAAIAVADKEADQAILVCSTGIGMSIAANKVKGIRAALCFDEMGARIAREQKDANVLCISGDTVSKAGLRRIVEVWFAAEFVGGRHQRRVDKIEAIEKDGHLKKPPIIEGEKN